MANDKQAIFESAIAAAKQSGRPFRVEHATGGASVVVYLTSEEIADAQARTAAEVEERKNLPPSIEERLAAVEKHLGLGKK
jgi:hypothetical protein